MQKMICLSFGLSSEEIEKGKTSFQNDNPDAPDLVVIGATEAMMDVRVGDLLDKWERGGNIRELYTQDNEDGSASAGGRGYRVVMVHTLRHEIVLRVMRAFKAVLADPQDLIFAVITDTARGWSLREYLNHLADEHKRMQRR